MPLDHQHQFEERALPLGAIYVLRDREPGLEKPIIEEITGSAALVALLGNTYMNRVVGPAVRSRECNALGRIATQVPLRSVRLATDPNNLLLLCETITMDLKRVISSDRIGDAEARS